MKVLIDNNEIELVNCRNCKYYHDLVVDSDESSFFHMHCYCSHWHRQIYDDEQVDNSFCSFGKPKDNK